MKGMPAIYLGHVVSKNHFRVFIYAVDGCKKLVNSWDEFESAMESGLWFATKEEAIASIPVEKPKRGRKPFKESELKPEQVKSVFSEDFNDNPIC